MGAYSSANPRIKLVLRLHPIDAPSRAAYLRRMATHRTFIATYIMGSGRNGTLYTGMTSNLYARVWQHKNHIFRGFTDRHDCTNLYWFERHA